ncbi:MAG: carbamoyltransferase [Parcubacteria group bacterium Gr01-1014_70]|nr:MAG: carbamoyltransferase [Parcubacteria group bacterium Gr01-1014_70]
MKGVVPCDTMRVAMRILGISAFYHDSAACLLEDGRIVAAAQEERFSRKKHDHRFPRHAIAYCLSEAGISIAEVDYVAFYDKPLLKFERILETYLAYAPRGIRSFLKAVPLWMKQKLWIREIIKKDLGYAGKVLFPEHHESHAASAFFPSPFPEAAILTIDGVGEWTTASYGVGEQNKLTLLADIVFPHSLGLLYSAFTYYLGFKVNSGEYKVMGLAPYGEPTYVETILKHLIRVCPDGSFQLDMSYFNYASGLTMTSEKFHSLFGFPPRSPNEPLTQRHMDIARSLQEVTEMIVLRMARHVRRVTGKRYLCLAGGVALNCVANGKILREGIFEDIWIQPAAGDAGGSLGAAFAVWYQYLDNMRHADGVHDEMRGGYLGISFSDEEIERYVRTHGMPFERLSTEALIRKTSEILSEGHVVGWFQGRMEFGPRALGARSILGDARNTQMQSILNLKIKFRESFRPFAPAVLRECVTDYFELDRPSPYMLLVAYVQRARRRAITNEEQHLFGIDRLRVPRSDIPAVTHIDYSARVQTVDKQTNPLFHALLSQFEQDTGCAVLVNTSFNVRGEPIVCTPEDAYRCFMRTRMDYLVIGSFLLDKKNQPVVIEKEDWKKEFELD